MPGLLQAIRTRPTITPEFRHAFDHQVMLTEQLRIKVLLVTLATLVGFLTIARLVAPDALDRIWNGRFQLWQSYVIFLPFVAFELTALAVLSRHIARRRSAVLAALRHRVRRGEHSHPCADGAHQRDGPYGRARVCRAARLFHRHHPVDAQARRGARNIPSSATP